MTRTLVALLIGTVCCWSFAACNPGGPGEPEDSELVTLQLNRLSTGDMEFCAPQEDSTEVCQTLPYDGDCVVIEIDVDPTTGRTCERCVLADGTVRDSGCQDTHIGCVLVTLPEPDCVVCAYVNGAIVFSTCVAQDETQCYTDRDCLSDDGRAGFCVDGQCIYTDGCLSDDDCPRGFICELPPYMDPVDGTNPLPYVGTCVPRDIACFADADCPQGFYCESWCYGAEPVDCGAEPSTDCLIAPPACEGVCRPIYNNPCENVACPVGQHCEVQFVECFTYPCEPIPVCVPDPMRCASDGDCGPGEFCRFDVCPMMPCTEDFCPPCYGVCVPVEPLYCNSDEECPDGQVCSWTDGASTESAPGLWAPGICVPAPLRCERDADCRMNGELGYCIDSVCMFQLDCDQTHAFCDMMPPICPTGQVNSVLNGCYGPCVDPAVCLPAQIDCRVNEDCPDGHECLMYCWDCIPEDPACIGGCAGVCVPSAPQCSSNSDCADATGTLGICLNGVCVFDPLYCDDSNPCPDDQVCEWSCASDSCLPGDQNCGERPIQCTGICVPAPSDCVIGGCSGEVCAEEPLASICIWQPEFACYQGARCERQASGACGWTMTEELRICLDAN